MRVYELIQRCSFDEVKEKLKLHYRDKDISRYRELYAELLSRCKPAREQEEMFIYITVTNPETDTLTEEFDENDSSLSYDISAYIQDDDTVYSIASLSYADFLQCFIDKSTLERFSPSNILAHCLWEITFYGFADNK